ncbi:IS30 family transposase [Roseivivax isoporae]|uniref:Transposase IS30 n=1 Tax=Roseivivax isoporae LMG 25204 TaxID=1449351 RepID=X7FA43_9RHOB|nr:IS30 family transposase [Roseivivax isoporae]ETX29548.1 transposase IS30 [Roseivivax isoporae LMG 25204]
MGRVYSQLNVAECRIIERWRYARVSVNEMARVLKRHRSTIFRELQRNHFQDRCMPDVVGYFAMAAQRKTADRRARQRKLLRYPDLRAEVTRKITHGWTPEQIAHRMIHDEASRRVCQETIYRHVYSVEGMRDELWWYLPNHRKTRRPRRARKRRQPKFDRDVSIFFRPDRVARRREFGHWEADLMLFEQRFGQTNVTSLVERTSRFTVLLKNPSKRTQPVMGKIVKAMRDLPIAARRSVTFDRGSEFVSWPHLQAETGTLTWFCDPSSPWQKGTVENTNRRARRWLPRKLDPTAVSDHELKMICDRLNATPRKCLGWKTPAEAFKEKMLEPSKHGPYPSSHQESRFQ